MCSSSTSLEKNTHIVHAYWKGLSLPFFFFLKHFKRRPQMAQSRMAWHWLSLHLSVIFMTPDLPPWHSGGTSLIWFVRLQRKAQKFLFLWKQSPGETVRCSYDRGAAAVCRLACCWPGVQRSLGRGLHHLGAEEFYAWLAWNSNYGAGHVMAKACNFCLCIMRAAKYVLHVLICLL